MSLSRSQFLSLGAAASTVPLLEWVRPASGHTRPAKLTDIEHVIS